ncbi:MAG: hypothetical protein KC619_30845 [Myxococcales bacterium]|nr:hypothetical protein [Myxococcales bacterium]
MSYDDPWGEAVLPHGPLEEINPGLWWVWAPCPGVPVTRNMSVFRLADGGLLLHSPTCLDEATMKQLDGLGPVQLLLVPNAGHRLDIRRYRKRYPDAKVIAPANARAKVEEVTPVDATCEETLPDLGIRLHRPDGMKEGYELVYEVDLPQGGRALLVNDVLADRHPHGPTGFSGFVSGLLGPPGGRLGQPRIVRVSFGKDRAAFRRFVERLAEVEDLRAMLTSHGGPTRGDVATQLREAAARM